MRRRPEKPLTERELTVIAILNMQAEMAMELGIYNQEAYAIEKADMKIPDDLQRRGYLDAHKRIGGALDGAVIYPASLKGVQALSQREDIYIKVRCNIAAHFAGKMMAQIISGENR